MDEKEHEKRVEELERKLKRRQEVFDSLTLEMAISISENLQVLLEFTSGNYEARAPENSSIEVFAELGKAINKAIDQFLMSNAALRSSEERFRNLAELLPEGVFELDSKGRYTYVNRAVTSVFGYSSEDLYNNLVPSQLVIPEDRGRVSENMKKSFKGEAMGGNRYTGVCADGREIPILIYSSPIMNEDGPAGLRGIVVDITKQEEAEKERIRLEKQIQHSQKLESLGVLAGGIAHDFNNLLTGILGNAELAMRRLPISSDSRDYLVNIGNAAERAADLCRQMLAYSGKGRFILEKLDLRREVDGILHLVNVSISKKATLKLDYANDLPLFEGDKTQIRQVIMNLVLNASEAMGDKSGLITIRVSEIECDEPFVADANLHGELSAGTYVSIEVSDTGSGMDAETKQRIFDPFFTTKFTGRGLGLSAVLGIVRGHNGAIKVLSEPGEGTTFTVLFPAVDETARLHGAPPSEEKAWTGFGTVLLVDDDEVVLDVGKNMLSSIGFKVLTARDGREGLKVFENHAREIVCVVLDLTMPIMDGRETFKEIKKINSGVPIILSSGYNEQEIVNEFTGRNLAGFIQKPYRISDLMEKLRNALSNTG